MITQKWKISTNTTEKKTSIKIIILILFHSLKEVKEKHIEQHGITPEVMSQAW